MTYLDLSSGERIMLVEIPVTAYNFEFEHWRNPDQTPEGVWSLSYQFKKGVSQFEDMGRKRIKTNIDVNTNPRILGIFENDEIDFLGKVKPEWVKPEYMDNGKQKINYKISFLSMLRSANLCGRYACLLIKK